MVGGYSKIPMTIPHDLSYPTMCYEVPRNFSIIIDWSDINVSTLYFSVLIQYKFWNSMKANQILFSVRKTRTSHFSQLNSLSPASHYGSFILNHSHFSTRPTGCTLVGKKFLNLADQASSQLRSEFEGIRQLSSCDIVSGIVC